MENQENKNTDKKCSACHSESEFFGQVPLRIKGHGGLSKLFFGELAELSEEMWRIDFYRCKKCGHLDLYDIDFSLPKQ